MQRPEVYLQSSIKDSTHYRRRAEELNATGYVDKTSTDKFGLYQAQSGKKVVVIDDEPSILSATVDMLSQFGAEVYKFDNPKEALEQIPSLRPDTVLSDVEMPGFDGFMVLAAINAMDFDE